MTSWLMSGAPPISDKMMLPAGLGEPTITCEEVSRLELALQRRREDVGYISAPVAIGLRTSERLNASLLMVPETNTHGGIDPVVQASGSDGNNVVNRRADNVIDDDEVDSNNSSGDGYVFNGFGDDDHVNPTHRTEDDTGNLNNDDVDDDDDDDDGGDDNIDDGEDVDDDDLDIDDDGDDEDDDDLTAFL